MPGSSNNLGGPRIADAVSAGQHRTSNDADGAFDAAITESLTVAVTDTNIATVVDNTLDSAIRFRVINGAPAPTAAITINFPASSKRGLTIWINETAYAVTLQKIGQSVTPPVLGSGTFAVVDYDGADVRLVSGGWPGAPAAYPWEFVAAASDETTLITSGTNKVRFRAPRAVTITSVKASLNAAQTGGSLFTVDVKKNGVSIFTTVLTSRRWAQGRPLD
jgi:hypothetical protein